MRNPFAHAASPKRELRQPERSTTPEFASVEIAAMYRGARVGGDFFDFLTVGSSRLLFLLMDVAGARDEALDIAAAVQDSFRASSPRLFNPDVSDGLNDADLLTELLLELNQTVIRHAGGVHCAPAFLGCYEEELGMLYYVNAGHPPALLDDSMRLSRLEADGLPLGLFSHGTYDAHLCVLEPGDALLLASKGLIEVKVKSEEFGIERLKQSFRAAPRQHARQLCAAVLADVDEFRKDQPFQNDMTALALVRNCDEFLKCLAAEAESLRTPSRWPRGHCAGYRVMLASAPQTPSSPALRTDEK